MSSLSLKPSENHDSIMFLKNQICEMFTFWFNAKVFLSKYHYLLFIPGHFCSVTKESSGPYSLRQFFIDGGSN